jgi:IPT/TIG domain-containing protein
VSLFAADSTAIARTLLVFGSATSITAVSPPATAGTVVDVVVTGPEGASAPSSSDYFKYERPTITGVSPNSGPKTAGTTMVVTGSGFALGTNATAFSFGGPLSTSVECASTSTCTVVTPAFAVNGYHSTAVVDVRALVGRLQSETTAAAKFTFYR